MRRRTLWGLGLCGFLVGTAASVAEIEATPAIGFTATTVAVGRFGDIEASNHAFLAKDARSRSWRDIWLSFQKTKGQSDLYVQSNVWAVGGTTGWHTHPGHSLIIVTAGTITAYDSDDESCKPHVYTAGMGFVDPGGGHVHVLRNEGNVEARTVAVQLIPAGATRRIDAEGSTACPF